VGVKKLESGTEILNVQKTITMRTKVFGDKTNLINPNRLSFSNINKTRNQNYKLTKPKFKTKSYNKLVLYN